MGIEGEGDVLVVSIAGAILWGVLPGQGCCGRCQVASFNRRGDSLGGAAPAGRVGAAKTCVSIAGAILWGVLLRRRRPGSTGRLFQSQGRFFGGCCLQILKRGIPGIGFNRRGDSLGGAAFNTIIFSSLAPPVSIAGAILWGVLLVADLHPEPGIAVSIAGAILWGVLRCCALERDPRSGCFNRRGDSLGGAALRIAVR